MDRYDLRFCLSYFVLYLSSRMKDFFVVYSEIVKKQRR